MAKPPLSKVKKQKKSNTTTKKLTAKKEEALQVAVEAVRADDAEVRIRMISLGWHLHRPGFLRRIIQD